MLLDSEYWQWVINYIQLQERQESSIAGESKLQLEIMHLMRSVPDCKQPKEEVEEEGNLN